VAIDLGYSYCSNVEYGVQGYTWAVGAYQYYDTTCTSAGYEWVTLPVSSFDSILSKARAYEAQGSTPQTSASNGPFDLSISDGGLISGAVAGVWALAWVLRQLRAALDTDGEKE